MVYFMSKLNWLFLKKPQISRHSRGEVEAGITPNGVDNPLRAGPKTLANLEPTRVGNWGPGGRSPRGGGLWGVCSSDLTTLTPFPAREGGKFGGALPSPRRRGAERRRTLSQRGWAKGGPGGEAPMAGGCGGCAPFTPTEVSLFEKGRPAPTLIKLGVEGAQAPSQGVRGICPQNKKEGANCPH